MSRRTQRWLIAGGVLLAALAILNPGYSSVSVDGPNGKIRSEKYRFGPSGAFGTYNRIVADDSGVTVEQR